VSTSASANSATRTKTIRAALAALALAACSQPSTHAQPIEHSLFADAPDLQWRLPDRLQEISGLAVTADGRLFGHDDEIGVIYEIDVARGAFVKWFALGDTIVTGDFEGLAIAPDGVFWLTTSAGELYRFQEGADQARVPFQRFDTGLEETCEVEGVAYASNESLILACKRYYRRGVTNAAALRTWAVNTTTTEALGPPSASFAEAAGVRRFEPSDVTLDQASGRVLVLSANAGALVELSPDGDVVSARALGEGHRQAEGVAVLPNGALLIADEGGNDQALLSRYSRRQ
jgi:uncharacterized protein YjiK